MPLRGGAAPNIRIVVLRLHRCALQQGYRRVDAISNRRTMVSSVAKRIMCDVYSLALLSHFFDCDDKQFLLAQRDRPDQHPKSAIL